MSEEKPSTSRTEGADGSKSTQALESEALAPGVTVSQVQAAFNSLRIKDRTKDRMIAAMAEELRARAGSKVWQPMLEEMSRDDAPAPHDFDRTELCNTLSRPRLTEAGALRVRERAKVDSERRPSRFRGPMVLSIARRIPPDCLLVTWTVPNTTVLSGYEVFVDGVLAQRVRSAGRTRALLHDLNLDKKMVVSVIALTPNGRCANIPASVTYEAVPA